MQLSKPIPAHRKTIRIRQYKRDFLQMSPGYRMARSRMKDPMDTCKWCGHKFGDGEMLGLAIPEKGTNFVLCGACCDQIEPAAIDLDARIVEALK